MNKKKSIIFQISIFFLFVFILINTLIVLQFKSFYLLELLLIDVLFITLYIFVLKKLDILTILKEKELINSRNLFLKNIMHELKTPITKGKILTDNCDNIKNMDILKGVFYRLEYLLNEFSKIEELTSCQIKLEVKNYRAVDLIDQALDMLLIDSSAINIKINESLDINVDFDLFSIALKNLIDNAFKYNINGKAEIIVDNHSIQIKNKGKKLTKNINEYYTAFNRDYEKSTDGLGLGLYISNNIIKLHEYKLEYKFKDNYHLFQIIF
jgi:two-component system OmpR family sensor kinase